MHFHDITRELQLFSTYQNAAVQAVKAAVTTFTSVASRAIYKTAYVPHQMVCNANVGRLPTISQRANCVEEYFSYFEDRFEARLW